MKNDLEKLMTKLGGGPVLVSHPKRVIARVGTFDITISSDNELENAEKFEQFCQELKAMLLMVTGIGKKKKVIETTAEEVAVTSTEPVPEKLTEANA